MGSLICEQVVDALRAEGVRAEYAYPGRKFPAITGPVAAVHMEKVDQSRGTVTVEVDTVSPAALGGTACELQSLQVLELLRKAGAVCTQGGCRYDPDGQVYMVPVLAEFITPAEETGKKLSFKTYSWAQTPHTYKEVLEREPVYVKNSAGEMKFSSMGPLKRTITGEGVFLGDGAVSAYLALEKLFADASAGTLTHPELGKRKVYFTELELLREQKPGGVSYRFAFREADESGAVPK